MLTQDVLALMAAMLEAGDRARFDSSVEPGDQHPSYHRPFEYTRRARDLYLAARCATVEHLRDVRETVDSQHLAEIVVPGWHRAMTSEERAAEREREIKGDL